MSSDAQLGGGLAGLHHGRDPAHGRVVMAGSVDSGARRDDFKLADGYIGGLSSEERQQNRMAVAIDYKVHSKMSAEQPELTSQRHADQPPLTGSEANMAGLGYDGASLRIEDAADPDEALLLFFLEKMRHKHRLTQPDVVDNIECVHEVQAAAVEDHRGQAEDAVNRLQGHKYDASAVNYHKDFVKKIQSHIKSIIKTGKGNMISTQAGYL